MNIVPPQTNLFTKSIQNQDMQAQLPEKYQKMLNMGIPRPAVEQKMRMDGVTIQSTKQNEEHVLPEKYQKMLNMGIPRPAVEQKMRMDGIILQNGSSPISLQSVVLKKVDLTTLSTKKDIEGIKGIDTSRKVPSLSEITNALKNLRPKKQM